MKPEQVPLSDEGRETRLKLIQRFLWKQRIFRELSILLIPLSLKSSSIIYKHNMNTMLKKTRKQALQIKKMYHKRKETY